jgi:hypothetical protein
VRRAVFSVRFSFNSNSNGDKMATDLEKLSEKIEDILATTRDESIKHVSKGHISNYHALFY